jgi:glycyl-tRNA synthetase beta chain
MGVKTGRHSFGHRFHGAHAINISSPRAYKTLLKEAFVIADFAERRQMIVDQIQQLTTAHDVSPIMPDSLVDEVTSIVEWPQALLAQFEPEFLDVPSEALIAAMQSHQKCFALRDKHQQLLPYFITVANIASINPKQVIAGNEKVMRARLSDAAFFFRQDQRQTLHQYRDKMPHVVFQVRLGSLQDKVNRMQRLMEQWVDPLQLTGSQAIRAAELSKCDLMTGMVGEFPELQGLMGYYYARHDGEDEAVAIALNEQYMPRFSGDELPTSALGLALSLADRLDTLVGTFAIGQKPTGDKDPFKLRRHALAVVRLLLATPAALNLSTLIQNALQGYQGLSSTESCIGELKPFILERLHSYYQGVGVAQEIVYAVRARQDEWLYDLDKRVHALRRFIQQPEAVSLSAACKRVNNLLQHASMDTRLREVDPSQLTEAAEKTLFEHIRTVEQRISPLYSCGDYSQILSHLASLHGPVDHFFEHVMVMVDDTSIKQNRLCLLARLQNVLQGVADISLLQQSV